MQDEVRDNLIDAVKSGTDPHVFNAHLNRFMRRFGGKLPDAMHVPVQALFAALRNGNLDEADTLRAEALRALGVEDEEPTGTEGTNGETGDVDASVGSEGGGTQDTVHGVEGLPDIDSAEDP